MATTWDYAIGQESIRIEIVEDNEVIGVVVELPIGCDVAAEAICNAHNEAVCCAPGDYSEAEWFR